MKNIVTYENWWVAQGDAHTGPFPVAQLRERLNSSDLNEEQLACPVGGDEWKPLSEWADVLGVKESEEVLPIPPPLPTVNSSGIQASLPDPPDPIGAKQTQNKVKSDEQEPLIYTVLFGLGIAVLVICYFWFAVVLWAVLGVSILAVLGCLLCAMSPDTSQSQRKDWLVGSGVAAIIAFGFWNWIGSHGFDVPVLSANATAKEITREYRDRVAHIRLVFSSESKGLFGSTVNSGGGTGSGLLIANDRDLGIIVTNRHVVDAVFAGAAENVIAVRCEISLASEDEWYEAKVAAIHKDLDLAILTVRKRFASKGAVRVASFHSIEQGDEVVALGNPEGIDFVTTEGIVSKIGNDTLATTAPINPGNSGGPLILKNRGAVIAFNTGTLVDLQNFNISILAERVLRRSTPADDSPPVLHPKAILFWVAKNAWKSSTPSSSWNWYADQEQVIDLLSTVPLEKPK